MYFLRELWSGGEDWRGSLRSLDTLGKGAEKEGIAERGRCSECACVCARTCMYMHRKQGRNPFRLNPCASQVLSQALTLLLLSKDKSISNPAPFWVLSGTEDLIVSALKCILSCGDDRVSHSTFPSCVPSPSIWWPLSPHTNPLEHMLQIVVRWSLKLYSWYRRETLKGRNVELGMWRLPKRGHLATIAISFSNWSLTLLLMFWHWLKSCLLCMRPSASSFTHVSGAYCKLLVVSILQN